MQQYEDTWEVCVGVALATWERTRWVEKGRGLDHGMAICDTTLWHRPDSENSKFKLGLPECYVMVRRMERIWAQLDFLTLKY